MSVIVVISGKQGSQWPTALFGTSVSRIKLASLTVSVQKLFYSCYISAITPILFSFRFLLLMFLLIRTGSDQFVRGIKTLPLQSLFVQINGPVNWQCK